MLSPLANASEFFLGGGLSTGTQSLTLDVGSPARFNTHGYLAEGGVSFGERDLALDLGGEAGKQDSMNQANGESAIENSSLTRFGAKAVLRFNRFGFGGGARHNEITLKSLSPGANFLESKYSGVTPFAVVNTSFVARRFRTTIEAQFVTGSLSAKDLPSAKMEELTISLRFFFTGE